MIGIAKHRAGSFSKPHVQRENWSQSNVFEQDPVSRFLGLMPRKEIARTCGSMANAIAAAAVEMNPSATTAIPFLAAAQESDRSSRQSPAHQHNAVHRADRASNRIPAADEMFLDDSFDNPVVCAPEHSRPGQYLCQ